MSDLVSAENARGVASERLFNLFHFLACFCSCERELGALSIHYKWWVRWRNLHENRIAK